MKRKGVVFEMIYHTDRPLGTPYGPTQRISLRYDAVQLYVLPIIESMFRNRIHIRRVGPLVAASRP